MTEPACLDLDRGQQIKLADIISSGTSSELEKFLSSQPDIIAQIDRALSLPNEFCNGMTCLTYAAMEGRLKHCEVLYKLNADPNTTDSHGKKALDVASTQKIRSFLRKAMCGEIERPSDGSPRFSTPPRSRGGSESKEMSPRLPVASPWSSSSSSVLSSSSSMSSILPSRSSSLSVPDEVRIDSRPPPPRTISFGRGPSRRGRNFKLLDDRQRIREIRTRLKELQPVTDSHVLTYEMEVEYGNNREEIRGLLAEEKELLEQEKVRLRTDRSYFESMVGIRKKPEFMKWVTMDMSYHSAWAACISTDPEWNRNVEKLQRWANRFTYREPQCMTDVVEIYPFVCVTQNRVSHAIRELAVDTGAEEGFYAPNVKRLSRAWEKTAFKHGERMYSADIWDWSRAMITYDSLSDILGALTVFHEEFSGVEILNVDCTFQKSSGVESVYDDTNGRRWQDVKVHFRFIHQCPQIISELQLCLGYFTHARRDLFRGLGGHEAYSRFRSVNEIERFLKHERRP